MTPIPLYFRREVLSTPLTLGWLRGQGSGGVSWFSLEPYPTVPQYNGSWLRGPIPGLGPLLQELPDPRWDDLPLASASLFGTDGWRHWVAAQPGSQQPGAVYHWQLSSFEGSETLENVIVHREKVLAWQDRARFGLGEVFPLPPMLDVEHFYRDGRRIAWRIVPEVQSS